MKRIQYVVVVEDAGPNYSAYAPDLPGCAATGRTVPEAIEHMREAIQLHIEGMIEDGEEPPPASARTAGIEAVIPSH